MQVRKLLDVLLFTLGKRSLTTSSILRIPVFLMVLRVVARVSMAFLQNKLLARIGLAEGPRYTVARDTLLRVARANPDLLSEPAPDVIFENFGDNSLDFQLRV